MTPITSELTIPAPRTGFYLGTGRSGPVALRLLRPGPTRVTVFSASFAAQLLAMRAAVAGTPVRVLTESPDTWAPVVQGGVDARIVLDNSRLLNQPGPSMIVDDRPEQSRREVADGQCLVDLRTLRQDRQGASIPDFGDLAQSDVSMFGVLTRDLALGIERTFGIERGMPALSNQLPPQTVALVVRGSVELVRVE